MAMEQAFIAPSSLAGPQLQPKTAAATALRYPLSKILVLLDAPGI